MTEESTVPTKQPTWGDGTNEPLTVEERNFLIGEYCRDQPLFSGGPTASGFATYARRIGVRFANGSLKSHFLVGTEYQLDPQDATRIKMVAGAPAPGGSPERSPIASRAMTTGHARSSFMKADPSIETWPTTQKRK